MSNFETKLKSAIKKLGLEEAVIVPAPQPGQQTQPQQQGMHPGATQIPNASNLDDIVNNHPEMKPLIAAQQKIQQQMAAVKAKALKDIQDQINKAKQIGAPIAATNPVAPVATQSNPPIVS